MRPSDRSARSQLLGTVRWLALGIALGAIALACGSGETAKTEAPKTPSAVAPEAPAAPQAPSAAAAPESQSDDDSLDVLPKVTEGVVPEGFPSDVPTYPRGGAGSAFTMAGVGVFASFLTEDAADPVISFYRSELAKNGWTVKDSADGAGVDGTKGDRTVQVRARPDPEGKTEIAINVSTGPAAAAAK